MRIPSVLLFLLAAPLALPLTAAHAQEPPSAPRPASTSPDLQGPFINPSRVVPSGKAPGKQVKKIKDTPDEQVYAVILATGDEVIGGLTDFALKYNVGDAHFTAIGAVQSATLAWYDLPRKLYHPIPVAQQVEVVSFVGDIAAFNGKPIVHAHSILSRPDGTTVAGHTFELIVNPTLEIFVTVDRTPLAKRDDSAVSGLKLIDPAH